LSRSQLSSPHEPAANSEPRRATRHDAQLDARLLFQISIAQTPIAVEQASSRTTIPGTLKLIGHTRNISETGLAFIVPSLRIGAQFAHVIGSRLRITLFLPSGHVEIHAMPVRYEQLPPEASERGYLIGVRITRMADDEWVRVVEYVRSLR
jgi:hypothetical protein